ncbi:MAG: FdtA/QdtA family cupin domain-containing protein [Prevotellaceae bacterium]|nr:FdtA/QdtA family cupin domain-containing protein [Prevotellaceae bacterium]
MTINDCKTIVFPTHSDCRGSLTLVDSTTVSELLPFAPRRWFWIHSTPHGITRGCHAHRTCWEIVTAISGQLKLTLDDGLNSKSIILDNPREGVVIPPMIWCKLSDFTEGCVCMALASEDYDTNGYINDYQVFVKEIKND